MRVRGRERRKDEREREREPSRRNVDDSDQDSVITVRLPETEEACNCARLKLRKTEIAEA